MWQECAHHVSTECVHSNSRLPESDKIMELWSIIPWIIMEWWWWRWGPTTAAVCASVGADPEMVLYAVNEYFKSCSKMVSVRWQARVEKFKATIAEYEWWKVQYWQLKKTVTDYERWKTQYWKVKTCYYKKIIK